MNKRGCLSFHMMGKLMSLFADMKRQLLIIEKHNMEYDTATRPYNFTKVAKAHTRRQSRRPELQLLTCSE
jgi:hypothetical protein